MDDKNLSLVFVYGTLKRDQGNNYLLETSRFIGEGSARKSYRMINVGYPVIMPEENGHPVAGEVYAVDDETLARLDRLESVGFSYDRSLTVVRVEDNFLVCFVYEGRWETWGRHFQREECQIQPNEDGHLVYAGYPRRQFDLEQNDTEQQKE